MLKNKILITLVLLTLAGCAGMGSQERSEIGVHADGTSKADTVSEYKIALAQRIAQANASKVYDGRPQALLRSVVVVKYVLDANGGLVRSDIVRSNRDRITEASAVASLRSAAPFPKPASSLLKHGRLEVMETWLFNNDGRFQLRTIAEPQMDE